MNMKYDFCGWATKNDLKCSDGRVIKQNAFKHNDGMKVPLVWDHRHDSTENILGHAVLENRTEGVYAYGVFNNTPAGQHAKESVQHGDIDRLSIYANQLQQKGYDVYHGMIRELSLVMAGANPGAYIENVIRHGEESPEEVVIIPNEYLEIYHAEDDKKDTSEEDKKTEDSEDDETVQDILDTLNPKQEKVMYALVAEALDVKNDDKKEGDSEDMKHNVFDKETDTNNDVLSHSDMQGIFKEAQKSSLKTAFEDYSLQHGIEQMDYLFPEARTVATTPEFISRDMGWVPKVMGAFHKTPFSRIKTIFADITEDEARAKGYIKGNKKVDEVFTLLKRTTDPTTIYKKQSFDRDDLVDIVDFDVVAWVKTEMRMMLDEEIARAALISDGRMSSSNDKISEDRIRPIWTDDDLFTIKKELEAYTNDNEKGKNFIRAAIKARKDYKGSGNPTLYTTDDVLTDCLLLEDTTGRMIYESQTQLATALRVKEIVVVPPMEGCIREAGADKFQLEGLIVNLHDYNIGADKGGAVNMFDDFDIDYNKQKYLIETRCSGALIKPFSAIALESKVVG